MDMTLPILALPVVAGALVGFAVPKLSLSIAVALGMWVTLVLFPSMPGLPVWLLPLVFGGAIGATTLTMWLFLRPGSGAKARAVVSAVAALGASLGLFFNVFGA